MAPQFDLVVAGGTVVDPSQNLNAQRDVAIKDGRIAGIGTFGPETALSRLDASGKIVTSGIVDMHVHVYEGVSHYGVDADDNCIRHGVTTVLDAGSSGAQTFPGFREYVIERVHTKIFALINISRPGMVTDVVGELEDIRNAAPQETLEMLERNRDILLGVKVRLEKRMAGENALASLRMAREVADAADVPIMVHIGGTVNPLTDFLPLLRPGDAMTHCFHAKTYGVLDEDGKVVPEVRDSVERGVLLDVGHGRGGFSFEVCRKAISQGLNPSTISSDIHSHNIHGPVFDMATTMSKFLHIGFPLDEVVRMSSVRPAQAMGMPDGTGTLAPGAPGDVSIFELRGGQFDYVDALGVHETGEQRLIPHAVVVDGRVHACVVDYD
jgi:dihydroorotase